MKGKDHTGARYGRLTVLGSRVVQKSRRRATLWFCQCDCGKTKETEGYQLDGGRVQSCGCLHYERVSAALTGHGMKSTQIYRVWAHMRRRCSDPKVESYPNYGGRGIRVCDRWASSFEAFFADVGHPPTPKHTLDRIDTDGDYCPGNVRWATVKDNCRNKRVHRFVEYAGRTMCLAEAAEIAGINYHTVRDRLDSGWPAERALSEPVKASGYRRPEF